VKDAAAAGATALLGVGVMASMILAQPPSPSDAAHPFRLATWVPLPEDGQLAFEKRFATPRDGGRGTARANASPSPTPIGRRGENVSSLAIENVIRQHPSVADVAICALPAAMGDDDMKACLVLRSGASLTPEEFFEFMRGPVPYFAIPRYVDLRASLPANALGRIMKHALRAEGIPHGTWDLESKGLVLHRGQRQAGQAAG
jgi:hypothetical protein